MHICNVQRIRDMKETLCNLLVRIVCVSVEPGSRTSAVDLATEWVVEKSGQCPKNGHFYGDSDISTLRHGKNCLGTPRSPWLGLLQ